MQILLIVCRYDGIIFLHEVNNMDIGQRIKNRRLELGLTQADLAKRMGYTNKSTIGKVENGNNDITQTKVVQYAHALNTTVAYLMGWEEEEDRAMKLAKDAVFHEELDPLIQEMPDNLRQALLSYAYLLLGKDNPNKG
jgi:transcriptional regulator with XRE-family HTH domain